MGQRLSVPRNTPVMDASGFYIMPGGVDIATYIQNDMLNFNADDFGNTMKEAVLGGTTTIVDTVICPKGKLPIDALCGQKNQIKDGGRTGQLWCNLVYRIGLVEITEAILGQFDALVKRHGVNSFLFFTATQNGISNSDSGISVADLKVALKMCRSLGVMACVRSMSWNTNDASAFGEIQASDEPQDDGQMMEPILRAAEDANCPLLVSSVTSLKTLESTVTARYRVPPVHVYASCAPSILLPSSVNGKQCHSKFLEHLSNGDIGTISSDQAGTNQPTGMARLGAVGQRLVAVWEAGVPSGWLDASSFINLVSTNAARQLGIYPAKGRICPGSDADLILWPISSLQHSGTGRPSMVMLRGKLMARNGQMATATDTTGPCITMDGNPMEISNPEPRGEIVPVDSFPTAVYSAVMATDRLRNRHQLGSNNGPWNASTTHAPERSAAKMKSETAEVEERTTSPVEQKMTTTTPQTSGRLSQSSASESAAARTVQGRRDLHASGFSLSGAQVDDNRPKRPGIRTSQPPGGQSNNPLW